MVHFQRSSKLQSPRSSGKNTRQQSKGVEEECLRMNKLKLEMGPNHEPGRSDPNTTDSVFVSDSEPKSESKLLHLAPVFLSI